MFPELSLSASYRHITKSLVDNLQPLILAAAGPLLLLPLPFSPKSHIYKRKVSNHLRGHSRSLGQRMLLVKSCITHLDAFELGHGEGAVLFLHNTPVLNSHQ